MKKQLIKLSGLIMFVSLIFRIISIILLSVYKVKEPGYTITQLFKDNYTCIISLVLLAVGMIVSKKTLIIISYAIEIFRSIIYMIYDIYYTVHNHTTYYVYLFFSNFSFLIMSAAMILFVIAVFQWKETDTEVIASKPVINTVPISDTYQSLKQDNTDILVEYKHLLDMGAITQEEFDTKKSELI